ncbi:MAG: hypothetical protein ACP5P4_16030 [Steroidobacteraceae bacterium]
MFTSSPVKTGARTGRLAHGAVGIAAVLTLLFASGAAHADPPRGHAFNAHFAADHGPRGGHFQGPRGDGPRPQGRQWAGHAPQSDWHAGEPRGGPWQSGADRRWDGPGHWDGHDGGWRDNRWHAGWDGDDWDHRDWHGAAWLGGYWGGYYWPPVNYGWNYPWFMASIPFGAVTLTFGGVPYYYVDRVYYAWNPYYDGYVVTDPPPVGVQMSSPAPAPAGAAAPQDFSAGGGVLGLRVTPLRGQDAQQSANDRYACNTWAVAQSGFDPLSARQDAQAPAGARAGYRRAFTACLHARGYSVQ